MPHQSRDRSCKTPGKEPAMSPAVVKEVSDLAVCRIVEHGFAVIVD